MEKKLTKAEMIEYLLRPSSAADDFYEPTFEEVLESESYEEIKARYEREKYGIPLFESDSKSNIRINKAAESNRVNNVLRIMSAIIHQHMEYGKTKSLEEIKVEIKRCCARHLSKQEPTDQTIDKYIEDALEKYPSRK